MPVMVWRYWVKTLGREMKLTTSSRSRTPTPSTKNVFIWGESSIIACILLPAVLLCGVHPAEQDRTGPRLLEDPRVELGLAQAAEVLEHRQDLLLAHQAAVQPDRTGGPRRQVEHVALAEQALGP